MTTKPLTCIDLFAGCGGFSLGLKRAGLDIRAAIDFDPKAVEVYRANFAETPHILCEDLTTFLPRQLEQLIGTDRVDVIAGGPPCQGFSQVRQRDGANNGSRMVHDPRRTLYQQYFEYVKHFQPQVFVMENVLGIRSADGGKYFTAVNATARELGYRVTGLIVDAWKLGVPQKRRRQLIVGTQIKCPDYFREEMIKPAFEFEGEMTLGDAIGDLPPLAANSGVDPRDYDLKLRAKQLAKESAKLYLTQVLEIELATRLTAHVARPHSERDIRDFKKLKEGETAKQALARGEVMEFPYDRSSFEDRYTRQHRRRLCSTIVAHLSKDGLMFIHPTQNRTLTAREAARVQTFPDWFKFPITRTHQYRVIGNAVPPLVGESVGMAIRSYLENDMNRSDKKNQPIKYLLEPLPKNNKEALKWLMRLVHAADENRLKKVESNEFKQGWYAIAFLYGGLHPDGALEHGTETSWDCGPVDRRIRAADMRLAVPYYVLSGWPVVLEPIAREAWRRFESQELNEDEFYCGEAAIAGMCFRRPELKSGVRRERELLLL